MEKDTINQGITENTAAKPKTHIVASFFDSTFVQVAGLLTTVVSASVAARDQIGKAFFKGMNRAGVFTDLQKIRDDKIAQAFKGDPAQVVSQVKKINFEYGKALEDEMKRFGVRNSFDKWEMLRSHQKTEAVVTALAVTGVALGAVLTIASNRRVSLKQDELERQAEEQATQR